MAQDMLHSRPEFGKTFTVALWVLGGVAAVQVLAVGWAIVTRPALAPPPPMAALPNPPVAPAPISVATALQEPAPPLPPVSLLETPPRTNPDQAAVDAANAARFPPILDQGSSEFFPPEAPTNQGDGNLVATGPAPSTPGLGESLLPGPRFSGPGSAPPLSALLSEAALRSPSALSIPDPEVAAMIDGGAEKRTSGNMQGALDSLRQAEALLPEHPRVLAEIAATYADMGLDRKASLYWERVRDLGPEKAGAWHAIATGELSGHRGGSAPAPPILKLGKIDALHDPALLSDQEERVALTVTIVADPNARPVPSEMAMAVYFYDLVDGEKTEASTADTSQKFTSPPYDWLSGGVETIEVIYHQPVFTPEQKRELGERKYYGYIIELYYRDELQDTAAFPPDLKSLDPSTMPSPVSEPAIGPENSLFPTVPTEE